jgi:hypothetical protein
VIVGAGLLNLAAHALGVVCLLGFVVSAFAAISIPALDGPEVAAKHGASGCN